MEKIIKIEDWVSFISIEENLNKAAEILINVNVKPNEWDCKDNLAGYVLSTDKNTYFLLIDDYQSCCEDWGTIACEDEFSNFIGANLIEVSQTTRDKVTQKYITDTLEDGSIDDAIFLNFKTDKGDLQFVVYNDHNGYYGHDVYIKMHELEETGL